MFVYVEMGRVLVTRISQTPERVLTQNTSKDVVPVNDVLFGGPAHLI